MHMCRETRVYGSENACLWVGKRVSMGSETRAYGQGNACIWVGTVGTKTYERNNERIMSFYLKDD